MSKRKKKKKGKPCSTQESALRLIRLNGPVKPATFAMLLWPRNPLWKKAVKGGHGTMRVGGGLCIAAGGYLGRLAARKLVKKTADGYEITAAGSKRLEALGNAA